MIIKRFARMKNKGMTVAEVLVSLSLGAILIAIVLSMWYLAYRNWALDRIRTGLRIDLEIAMERVKDEIRLSNINYANFYPPDALEYTAISFAVPKKDSDDDRFFSLDEDND